MNNICADCLNFKPDISSGLMPGGCVTYDEYIFGCRPACAKFISRINDETSEDQENIR